MIVLLTFFFVPPLNAQFSSIEDTSEVPNTQTCNDSELTVTVINTNPFNSISYDINLLFITGSFVATELPSGFSQNVNGTIESNSSILFNSQETQVFVFKGIMSDNGITGKLIVIEPGVSNLQGSFSFGALEVVDVNEFNSTESVSNLIATNVLLDDLDACNQSPFANFQTLYISGTLIIDTDYCFNNNDDSDAASVIVMGEGAEIIVQANSNLVISNRKIFGCDNFWKSITVEDGGSLTIINSKIEDAQYAVLANDGSTINVRKTIFNNNYVGIFAPSASFGNQNNINFNGFYGNTFTSDGNLKAPYPNQSPIPDALPYAGMNINNTPSVVINYTPFFKTTFNNLANGIISYNSTLTLGNVDFMDIQVIPNTIYPSSGRGIFAKATSLYHGLDQSNIFMDPQYVNCDVGIFAEGINVTLANLTMSKVRTGIHLQNSYARLLSVNDNTINATQTGIFLNDNNLNYTAEVKDNLITIENPNTIGYGIRGAGMIDFTVDGYGWDIENNLVDVSQATFGTGILYDNGDFNNYIENSVITHLEDLDNHTGYRLAGGANNRILCNTFVGNASATTLTPQPTVGYDFSGTNQSDISCNEGHDTDIGIQVFGMGDNSLVRGNHIWDAGNGLQLGLDPTQGNAIIGEQAHHGNIWEIDANLNDNNWGAVHFGDQNIILQSEFKVDDGVAPPIANRTFLPSISTINAPNATWFKIETGFAPYNCSTANTCPDGIGWHGFVDGGGVTKLDEKIAQGNLVTDGYDASMNWVAQRHLYQKLVFNNYDATNPITPADFIIANFYTTQSNTTIEEFNLLSEGINDAFILDPASESSRLSQQSNITAQLDSLINLEEAIQSETLTPAELATKMAEKENVLSALHSLDEAGVGFSEQINTQKATAITNLLSDNANISTSHPYEANEKEINQIYLTKKLDDAVPYTTQDIQIISSIANQCPLSGGDAVYKARAMMAALSPSQTYDDVVLCQSNNESKRIGGSKEKRLLELTVQPNPTADIIEIQVTSTLEEANRSALTLFIYNSLGQKMMEEKISYNQSITYDVSSYDAGIYTVLIRNNKGIVMRSSKVVVLSN